MGHIQKTKKKKDKQKKKKSLNLWEYLEMKTRIEMKKNPDPISTIEIKREDQNMKFF